MHEPAVQEQIGRIVQRAGRNNAEAAFRAAVEERLRSLESQMGEVKARLNGLLFFIASTVITQVVLKLWA
jgi:hypothetical protein